MWWCIAWWFLCDGACVVVYSMVGFVGYYLCGGVYCGGL